MADIDSPETRTRGRNDPRLARGNCRAIIRSATGLSNTKTPPGCSTGGAWTFISRSSLQRRRSNLERIAAMQKIHLTDDVVRNLPFTALGGRRVHFADATVENMRLVVGGGRKAFYFVPDQPGNSGILRIGEYPETTTDRAREIAARLKSAVDTSDIGANSPDRLEQSGPTWKTSPAVPQPQCGQGCEVPATVLPDPGSQPLGTQADRAGCGYGRGRTDKLIAGSTSIGPELPEQGQNVLQLGDAAQKSIRVWAARKSRFASHVPDASVARCSPISPLIRTRDAGLRCGGGRR